MNNEKKAKVISIYNLKGGVSKTISSVNMSVILAEKGFNVLLIDNDPQANTTMSFDMVDTQKYSMLELLCNKELSVKDVIRNTYIKGLDILPSRIDLFEAEIYLNTHMNRYGILKKKLQEVISEYDYIIIDNHPSISTITNNGLCASDEVIVPLSSDKYALYGLSYIFDKINEVKEEANPNLVVGGIFLSKYRNVNVGKEVKEYLKEELNQKLFNTVIRDTAKVSESTFGEPLVKYAPKCTASQDYYSLVEEIFGV